MSKLPLVTVLLVTACGVEPVASVEELPVASRAKAPDAMWRALVAQEPRSFIVAMTPTSTDKTERRRAKSRLVETAPDAERMIERDWEELPLMQVRATTLDAALAMMERDDVVAAYDIEQYQLTDAESFPLIRQPAAAAAGYVGAGTSVAVLDTGLDYSRSDFGNCTAPGVPSTCRVAYAQDFAPSDGARDANGHGTNVAGIIAGVAPGAKLIGLDVFNGEGAWNTDIISAINWSIANRQNYNIAALNLSLGGGSSTSPCANDAIGVALAAARNAGIAPVVASGNNGYSNAISSPGCSPAAISVGAVYDSNVGGLSYSNCRDLTTEADKITCFSNSASFLTVLAPGALITAAGYTMAGTSQATPHVAGAIAVLRAAFPSETVDQLVGRLTQTGKPITDARNGVTKSRIDVFAALGSTQGDTAPPTGSVVINGGAALTRTASVSLAIAASDASGVDKMCVTNTEACTVFEAFAVAKTWSLAAGDGKKTVRVFLRDKRGNTTTAATSPSASIMLDITAPTGGSVTAAGGNAQIALSWTGFADAGSGVASYRVVAATGEVAPANCSGSAVYSGSATSTTIASLVNGTKYAFRVCAVDAAGNVSTGATVTAAPRSETNPPVGTVRINDGASMTRSRAVSLALGATDDTRVAQMCITEATTCTAFVAYTATAAFTFAADGVRTVRVWYRDAWGNTSAPAAASILVDSTAPAGGVLAATAGPARLTLSWTAASDTGSGLAGYKLVATPGTLAPATGCSTGTTLFSGLATSFVHTVEARSTWSYRLCAVDRAGNISAGSTKTATAGGQQ
jgi:subtilisin family serine protease